MPAATNLNVGTPPQIQASDNQNPAITRVAYSPAATKGNTHIETQVITLAKRTVSGSAGSVTIVGGIVTSYTAPT